MTNHKGRTAITVCCSAAVVVLAAGCGGASAESPSSTSTSLTITTTKSPFSNLTQEPTPPATSGDETGSGGADAFPGLPSSKIRAPPTMMIYWEKCGRSDQPGRTHRCGPTGMTDVRRRRENEATRRQAPWVPAVAAGGWRPGRRG